MSAEEETMTSQTPEQILRQAVGRLESGDIQGGLTAAREATAEAVKAGDLIFASEGSAQTSRTLRRIISDTKPNNQDRSSLFSEAAQAADQGVVYARQLQEQGDLRALPHVLVEAGNVAEGRGNLLQARTLFHEAVQYKDSLDPERFPMEYGLVIEFKSLTVDAKLGEAEAFTNAQKKVAELAAKVPEGKLTADNRDVWASGGYLSLADAILYRKDPKQIAEAKGYLAAAQKIIDANPNLVNRKKDLENATRVVEAREGIMQEFEAAQVLRTQGKEEEAIAAYNALIQRAETAGDLWFAIEARHQMGVAYMQQKTYPQALDVLRQTQEEARDFDPMLLGATLRDIASVQRHENHLDEARQTLRESIAVLKDTPAKDQEGLSEIALGRVEGALHNPDSDTHFENGFSLLEEAGEKEYLLAKGHEYRAETRKNNGDTQGALADLTIARSIYESLGSERFSRDISQVDKVVDEINSGASSA